MILNNYYRPNTHASDNRGKMIAVIGLPCIVSVGLSIVTEVTGSKIHLLVF